MDFHSLTRKDLQFLCKLNKIAANTKNHVMADALRDLDIVEGIEKFLDASQSKTVDLDESKENVEVSTSKVPATRNRTTGQKVKTTEVENLKPTNTRTTRRTAKKLAGGVEESKNDALETPALSSTRRKALATSSCRNVNSQLNDCELDAKEDLKSPAAVVARGRNKVATTSTAVKKESVVQKTYGTRRSTRQTEKKSGESRVRKESEKAIEIISLLDEDDASSDEVSTVEVPESTFNAGIPNAEVEGICNALEELDVDISEEKQDSGEVDNLKPKSDEINPPEEGNLVEELNNGVSSPCENVESEQKKLEHEVMVSEEHPDIVIDDNTNSTGVAGGEDMEVETLPGNTEDLNGPPESKIEDVSEMNNGSSIMDSDMILDTNENPTESLNSVNENKCSPDDVCTNDIKEVSENKDNETSDAIDILSPAFESVEIPQPDVFSVDSQFNVDNQPSECKHSSPETSVTSSRRKVDMYSTTMKTENALQTKSDMAVKFDFIDDDVDEKVEEKEEIVKFDNLKPESDVTNEVFENMGDETDEDEDHQTEVDVALSGEISDVFESSSIKENDMLKTPSLSTTRRKTPATSSSRNDCEEEAKEGQTMELCTPATALASSRRKEATPSTTIEKKGTLQKEFSSRRSTRLLTEKKSEKSTMIKESEKVVKIDLMVDEVNLNFEDTLPVEIPENTMDAGIPDAKMEDVCNSFEKLDVVDNQKVESDESESILDDNADVESEEISNPCANFDLEEEKHLEENAIELNQVPENNGSSTVVNDGNPEDFITDLFTESKVNEKADSDSCEENQISQNQSILITENGVPNPLKKTGTFVSDDKENKSVKEKGKNVVMKENLEDISLRQLRKRFKSLKLKTMNADNNSTIQEARPALQMLCENQLVGDDTKY